MKVKNIIYFFTFILNSLHLAFIFAMKGSQRNANASAPCSSIVQYKVADIISSNMLLLFTQFCWTLKLFHFLNSSRISIKDFVPHKQTRFVRHIFSMVLHRQVFWSCVWCWLMYMKFTTDYFFRPLKHLFDRKPNARVDFYKHICATIMRHAVSKQYVW